MKFGDQLKSLMIQQWSGEYIQYNALKAILKGSPPQSSIAAIADDDASSSVQQKEQVKKQQVEAELLEWRQHLSTDFFQQLEIEIDKVQVFYASHLSAISRCLDSAQLLFFRKRLLPVGQRHLSGRVSEQERVDHLAAVSAACHHLVHDLHLLLSYVEVNRTAIRKIVKKYDKHFSLNTGGKLLRLVHAERTFFDARALLAVIREAESFKTQISKYLVRREFIF
jgi:SPX domain protein involved in polyphosphate accumulation